MIKMALLLLCSALLYVTVAFAFTTTTTTTITITKTQFHHSCSSTFTPLPLLVNIDRNNNHDNNNIINRHKYHRKSQSSLSLLPSSSLSSSSLSSSSSSSSLISGLELQRLRLLRSPNRQALPLRLPSSSRCPLLPYYSSPPLPLRPLTVQKALASDDENTSTNNDDDDDGDDISFNVKTTIGLIGGQSLLIFLAVFVAKLVGTPNYGLGINVDFGLSSVWSGIRWTLPLGVLAILLDFIEDKFPSLQDVTKATQSSVLSLLGDKFRPVGGTVVALALGVVAGLGEEMLFRGVLQDQLGMKIGNDVFAVGITSVIFGLLHAVTPLYAALASLASVYFGWLYIATGNLAVPIVTHAFYDWAALLFAHWTVANLSTDQQRSLLEWRRTGD